MTPSKVKTYRWISLWFLVTLPVIAWDASYCLLRPRSMKGGDLHWIWKPYSLYQEIDYVYGIPAFESGDGFTSAQAVMNIVETGINILYLYLAHIADWPAAPLVGFTAAILTLAKTILYLMQEYFCGFCAVGHNSAGRLLLYYIIPNGFWIVFPALITYKLGQDLVNLLDVAGRRKEKTINGKTL